MSRRILVVEDDQELQDVLVEVLEDAGFDVCPASNSAEALLAGRRFEPDLVITDVRMEGMDGLDCLAHLRRVVPNFRCIVMTGYADQDAPSRAMERAADDSLRKPFGLEELLTAVRRVLDPQPERERYEALLSPLLEGARSLLRAVDAARSWVDRSALERDRESLYRNFYVGVRSGELTQDEALMVWDRLEGLERKREMLFAGTLAPEDRQALVEGFHHLADTVVALCRQDYLYRDIRPPGGVPHRTFQLFYRRVKEGAISPEQVRLAAALRTVQPSDLEEDPEAGALGSHVWLEPAEP